MARVGAWLSTLVIASFGAGASFLISQTMASQHASELRREASLTAGGLAHVIASRLEEQDLGPLRRWAWAALPATDPPAWHSNAAYFLEDHPAFSAIARVEDGRIADVATSGDGREMLRALEPEISQLMLQSEAPNSPREASVGPVRLPDGRAVFALRVGTPRAADGEGATVALYVPEISLALVLERRAAGFAIRVRCGREVVYGSPNAEPDAAEDAFSAVEPVRLSVGSEWSVVVNATRSVVAARRKPHLTALVAGLLISVLVASLVHVSQVSRMRAAALASSNLDLLDRIDAADRDQAEIRRLNQVLEARVAERTAALEETIAELETFNYSVSHDLRSPLGAILNFAAILEQDYGERLDANARDYLQRIASSATAVVTLMDGLLAFSRSGREELRKTHVDVQRLIEGLRDEYRPALQASGGSLHVGELPFAYADPAMLRFIFANLISNACKFVRKGEAPCVNVGGKIDGNEVVYFVRDEGVGFDMRYAEKLFGVFERLHASDEYEGHGVGLAIVARLVRRHGGRAWAEGALGKGATFYFTLPVRREGDASPGFPHV